MHNLFEMKGMKQYQKISTICAMIILLLCGVVASVRMGFTDPAMREGDTDIVELYEDPTSYTSEDAVSAADIIVEVNNEKTVADNVVFSVVFNFRGYDTLGESFILIGGVAGCMLVLRKTS